MDALSLGEPVHSAGEPVVIVASGAVDAISSSSRRRKKPTMPAA